MRHNTGGHHRKSKRFQSHDYASAAAYFVTIVAKHRTCLFGRVAGGKMMFSPSGHIADEYFRSIPEHFANAEIDVYQIMPNHVHGIIVLHEYNHWTAQAPSNVGARHASPLRDPSNPRGFEPGSMGAIAASFKSAVSRRARMEFDIAHIWQRNYDDHIIRGEKDWRAIREYILSNPANWNDDEENLGM
jgi:REP element-mobilizing transposase RayT